MSVREITDAIETGNICFGIRQCIKNKKNLKAVFVVKDVRDETIDLLESEGIEFSVLKSKKDLVKQLDLTFESEVYSILNASSSKKK